MAPVCVYVLCDLLPGWKFKVGSRGQGPEEFLRFSAQGYTFYHIPEAVGLSSAPGGYAYSLELGSLSRLPSRTAQGPR